jgi:GNAT superfamily N-acetyltransferase
MYQSLGNLTLKSGETVEAGVVVAPDADWSERLAKLLGHKQPIWRWQIETLLTHDLGVEVFFHVLHREGTPFAQIMTAESHGVGMLGHVWTEPQERGKAAAPLLLERLLEHFRARGGRALYLGTGFASAPYRIYEKCGFRGVEEGSGVMACFEEPQDEFERVYFAPGEAVIEPLNWMHWPASAALFASDLPGVVRNAHLGLLGRTLCEGPLLHALNIEHEREEEHPRVWVTKKAENGAVVGMASREVHPLWPHTDIVDVYCHPAWWDRADELLKRLPPSSGRSVAYCDAGVQAKREVLLAAGYQSLTTLPRWVAHNAMRTSWVDVEVFVED